MKPAKIVFMGTPQFAVPSLQVLLQPQPHWQCVAVVTQPAKAQGRGRRVQPSPVANVAEQAGITVHTPASLKKPSFAPILAEHQPDLILVAAYGKILPKALLALPPLGCINLHASLLPALRGASPIAHAILHDERETGVCLMAMEEGMDTGPVYGRCTIPIEPESTCGTLTEQLAEAAAQLLAANLQALLAQTLVPIPQEHSQATYAPLLQKSDGYVDFSWSASRIDRCIRAFHPWPKACAWLHGKQIALLQAKPLDQAPASPDLAPHPQLAPGTLHRGADGAILVQCGQGVLQLQQIQPEGRAAMDPKAWLAGRSAQFGDRFTLRPPQAG